MLGHAYVHALAYQLRSVMRLRLNEGSTSMISEQALWDQEKFQAAKLMVKGEEIHAMRKLTTMDDTVASITHLFSFGEEARFPSIDGSVQITKLSIREPANPM